MQKKAVVSEEKSAATKSMPSPMKPILTAVDSACQKNAQELPTAKHIGEVLKLVRESKKEQIKDVVAVLRISERYLLAIEEMDIDMLPEKVYTLGFVRSYADYLGIDPQKSVNQFKTEIYAATTLIKKLSVPTPVNTAPLPTKKILWVVVALIILLGSAYVQWGGISTSSLDQEISDLLQPIENVTPFVGTAITAPKFFQEAEESVIETEIDAKIALDPVE